MGPGVAIMIEAIGWEDAEEQALIEDYVGFCIRDLLPDLLKQYPSFAVTVIADHNLVGERKWGELQVCSWFNDIPTYFRLRLRRSGVSLHNQLKTAGHECTHIKQYREDGLFQIDETIWNYKGEMVDTSKLKKWKEPWELEARAEEKGLLERYIEEHLGYDDDDTKPSWYVDAP